MEHQKSTPDQSDSEELQAPSSGNVFPVLSFLSCETYDFSVDSQPDSSSRDVSQLSHVYRLASGWNDQEQKSPVQPNIIVVQTLKDQSLFNTGCDSDNQDVSQTQDPRPVSAGIVELVKDASGKPLPKSSDQRSKTVLNESAIENVESTTDQRDIREVEDTSNERNAGEIEDETNDIYLGEEDASNQTNLKEETVIHLRDVENITNQSNVDVENTANENNVTNFENSKDQLEQTSFSNDSSQKFDVEEVSQSDIYSSLSNTEETSTINATDPEMSVSEFTIINIVVEPKSHGDANENLQIAINNPNPGIDSQEPLDLPVQPVAIKLETTGNKQLCEQSTAKGPITNKNLEDTQHQSFSKDNDNNEKITVKISQKYSQSLDLKAMEEKSVQPNIRTAVNATVEETKQIQEVVQHNQLFPDYNIANNIAGQAVELNSNSTEQTTQPVNQFLDFESTIEDYSLHSKVIADEQTRNKSTDSDILIAANPIIHEIKTEELEKLQETQKNWKHDEGLSTKIINLVTSSESMPNLEYASNEDDIEVIRTPESITDYVDIDAKSSGSVAIAHSIITEDELYALLVHKSVIEDNLHDSPEENRNETTKNLYEANIKSCKTIESENPQYQTLNDREKIVAIQTNVLPKLITNLKCIETTVLKTFEGMKMSNQINPTSFHVMSNVPSKARTDQSVLAKGSPEAPRIEDGEESIIVTQPTCINICQSLKIIPDTSKGNIEKDHSLITLNVESDKPSLNWSTVVVPVKGDPVSKDPPPQDYDPRGYPQPGYPPQGYPPQGGYPPQPGFAAPYQPVYPQSYPAPPTYPPPPSYPPVAQPPQGQQSSFASSCLGSCVGCLTATVCSCCATCLLGIAGSGNHGGGGGGGRHPGDPGMMPGAPGVPGTGAVAPGLPGTGAAAPGLPGTGSPMDQPWQGTGAAAPGLPGTGSPVDQPWQGTGAAAPEAHHPPESDADSSSSSSDDDET